MDTSEYWRAFFDFWPENIDRQGAILTKTGESIRFEGFMLSPGILLCERSAPDASGARKAFISYDQIEMVKLPTTLPIEEFKAMSFRAPKGKAPVRQSLASTAT